MKISQEDIIASSEHIDALVIAARIASAENAGRRLVEVAAQIMNEDPSISFETMSKAFDFLAMDNRFDRQSVKNIAMNFARLAVLPGEEQKKFRQRFISEILKKIA